MLSTPVAGNIGVSIGDDGVAIIDDQFAPLAPKIRAAIALLSDKPIRFVINTHWHGDHTGANESFGRNGAIIIAQGNVRKRMSATQIGALSGVRRRRHRPRAAYHHVRRVGDAALEWRRSRGDSPAAAHTDGDVVNSLAQGQCRSHGRQFFHRSVTRLLITTAAAVTEGMLAAVKWALGTWTTTPRSCPATDPWPTSAGCKSIHDMLSRRCASAS